MREELIEKITRASGVQAGEMVLIHFWGEDSEKHHADAFMAAVASLGATPVFLQQARSLNHRIFAGAGDTCFGEAYFERLSHFDAVLDVFAYQPILLGYELPPEKFDHYRRYIATLFSALTKAKRFAQIRLPTESNALETDLEPADYISRMEKAYDIDYDELLAACRRKKEGLSLHDRVILQTGGSCQLFLDLSGREWYIDAGDGDWPCGEIYIAPRETETKGSVFFERLFIGELGEFEQVTLFVEAGKVQDSDRELVADFFRSLAPEERVVCELGLGMNPNIKELCGYTVLDEKKANTFHIAIGANQMFGGENSAGLHMDFVGSGRFEIRKAE